MSDDLDNLERLANAATAGAWSSDTDMPHARKPRLFTTDKLLAEFGNAESPETAQDEWEANAAYSAAADPGTILDLIAEIREARNWRNAEGIAHTALTEK